MTVEELYDEISAIDAIFPGSHTSVARQIHSFSIPEHEAISIQMSFPEDYPEETPSLVQVISKDLIMFPDTNYLEKNILEVLARVFNVGEVCMFELVTEVQSFLEKYENDRKEMQKLAAEVHKLQHINPLDGWIQSEPIVDRNSTFIGFARKVDSIEEAKSYLGLLITDRKISRATHNISSWRIRKENGVQYQDCDDDGETAAGARLLHLLTMMDAWNVIVVVARWFGGIHLGPDRFKHINSAAREAVIRGGFTDFEAHESTNNAHRKKKK
ncbi:ribosomal protein S5 domain 2-type protein [Scheffersomyces xylosifermentans]|uniref:ribosomal protein S5 domain 2-type protein n=1 Tax=Scheffersomyces xylosifermentans TaxID=1304137 RepID=UPI00315D9491